ncbi:hypothetical protein LTR08_005301 [Meristemomyces frigidus]|nr:hypothetical protein LTR08_005301 [Meristemomyces frigidus]
MALVEYSDSEGEEERAQQSPPPSGPPTKKRKVSTEATDNQLPPLPTSFHDLYSSTVRTSTQDDPSLHAGRKRVTPHVEGNWPTHVYLEWHPQPAEHRILADLLTAESKANPSSTTAANTGINSLLQTDLGVPLPLHVSLSRPLVLKTEQRAPFIDQLRNRVQASGVRTFSAAPHELKWHPNENGSRYFLVLSLQRPENDELTKLLSASNYVAKTFQQPLLYQEDSRSSKGSGAIAKQNARLDEAGKFHISIAWSLDRPASIDGPSGNDCGQRGAAESVTFATLLGGLDIAFAVVKVRIGQDVTTVSLLAARRKALF